MRICSWTAASRIIRETFYSSLRMSEDVMLELGVPRAEAQRTVAIFQDRDERLLLETFASIRTKQMIQTTKQITEEAAGLLEADRA
jgi:hypothetical protein